MDQSHAFVFFDPWMGAIHLWARLANRQVFCAIPRRYDAGSRLVGIQALWQFLVVIGGDLAVRVEYPHPEGLQRDDVPSLGCVHNGVGTGADLGTGPHSVAGISGDVLGGSANFNPHQHGAFFASLGDLCFLGAWQ